MRLNAGRGGPSGGFEISRACCLDRPRVLDRERAAEGYEPGRQQLGQSSAYQTLHLLKLLIWDMVPVNDAVRCSFLKGHYSARHELM